MNKFGGGRPDSKIYIKWWHKASFIKICSESIKSNGDGDMGCGGVHVFL